MTSHPNGAPGEPVSNRCERYMNLAYGLGAGYPTARAHWEAAGPKTVGMSTPPRGALVFWDTSNSAGHVALSLGGGRVVSTDFDGTNFSSGRISEGPIEAIDGWGQRLGWRAPNFRVGSEQ
jgi:cell wall-associated NlpC family hydrolase